MNFTTQSHSFLKQPVKQLCAAMLCMIAMVFSAASYAEQSADSLQNSESAAIAQTVNINTADADTLTDVMKGVGEKKAHAIVVYRETHGDFTSLDDLLQVKGIGEKTLERNRAYLSVN